MAALDIFAPDNADWLNTITNELAQDLDTALDFISSEFEGDRARAQRYYNGKSDLKVDANRSAYVKTLVRDTIRGVRPSLMRVFTSCWYPVEYVPSTMQQAQYADLQTQWVAQLFEDLGGYKTIYSAFHDAMLHKLGVVKYWWDDSDDPVYRTYTNLSMQQVEMLTSHPQVEILRSEERDLMLPGGQSLPTFDVEVIGHRATGQACMSWVPLSEFLIDRNATSIHDFRVIAHRRNVRKGDIIAMMPDLTLDDLDGLNADDVEVSRFAEESDAKRGYTVHPSQEDTQDESMQDVLLTEAYYRADLDGTGIPQLYKFLLGGTRYELLDYERATRVPFAMFAIDPEPGTVFGKSLYDLVQQEQDAVTSVTRATIDNFHMTNNPRLAVHEHMVNMEDVLNNDMGSPIRVRSAGQIQVIDTPFTGGQALPLLQHIEKDVEGKTGVTKASAGLEPDALQSTDKDAVRNTIQAAMGQVELMARNLAESGMKDLFSGLLELSIENMDAQQIIRTNAGILQVQIDHFDPKMGMRVEVGIGTGNYEERLMAMDQIAADQEKVMATMGTGNGVVSLQQMQNAKADKYKMLGIHNIGRYFTPITPEMEQQIAQQQAQQAQQDAQMQQQAQMAQVQALTQAESIKADAAIRVAQGKGQVDLMKMDQQGKIDSAEALMKDDLERDKMLQDLFIEIAKLREDFARASMTVSAAQNAN